MSQRSKNMCNRISLKILLLISVFFPSIVCSISSAATIFVDGDAIGANNGSSWPDAYNCLQEGLAYAGSHPDVNEIRVAEGTYRPDEGGGQTSGDREATFGLMNGVAIYGGYAGYGEPDPNARDPNTYVTILSGDLDGNDMPVGDPCDLLTELSRCENSLHVVTGSGTDATAVLDGFTITAGNANGAGDRGRGGGMYNYSGSPTVTNCNFSKNSSDVGGGMYNYDYSSPMITNCTFSNNEAELGGGMENGYNSNPTLTNCTFSDNEAGWGGGMDNGYHSNPTMTNCAFSGNSAYYCGGMYNDNSSPSITSCTFGENSAEIGGGLCNFCGSDSNITNCTFSGNSAYDDGGGMANMDCNPTVTNCTFSGNSAEDQGGGIANESGNPTVTNCILWSNSDGGGMDEAAQIDSGDPNVNFSCVQGWTGSLGGTGNIGENPLFVDADGPDNIVGTEDDNLRLSPGSPCIDAGDNDSVPGGVTADLDGHDRIVDGDCNDTEIVDMGAYEFGWAYIGDFAGGCDVDFKDFAVFALAWLTEDGEPGYNPDFDIGIPADNYIDIFDLDAFADNWLAGL